MALYGMTKSQLMKEARKERLLQALGPELSGDDPNLWFCGTAELAWATSLPMTTTRRLLNELWDEKLVEVHSSGDGFVWCHKCDFVEKAA